MQDRVCFDDDGRQGTTEASMRVYIVRHGKAEDGPEPVPEMPRPEGYSADWERPLTERGRSQATYLGQTLKGHERRLRFILASRYPRAIQTARLIAAETESQVICVPGLEVDHSVSEALRLLDEYKACRSVMLVGHNPQLGELLSVLANGLPPEGLVLKTGELVGLDIRSNWPIGSAKVVMRVREGEEPVGKVRGCGRASGTSSAA